MSSDSSDQRVKHMCARKRSYLLTKENLTVNKKDCDVKGPPVAIIGQGSFASYLVAQLLKEDTDVTHFLTKGKVQGNLEGIAIKNFNTDKGLARHMDRAAQQGVEYFLTAFYNHKIPQDLVDGYDGKLMNLHPSLLPLYKGPSPIEEMMADGVYQGGVTIHLIDERMDAGDILGQRDFELNSGHNKHCLSDNYKRAVEQGTRLFGYILENIDEIEPVRQKEIIHRLRRAMILPNKQIRKRKKVLCDY